jgi:hypothetical protein
MNDLDAETAGGDPITPFEPSPAPSPAERPFDEPPEVAPGEPSRDIPPPAPLEAPPPGA